MKTLDNKRYFELDSLRGLAAFAVFLCHIISMYKLNNMSSSILQNCFVHIIWDGAAAVVFFFVLSGFVLSLPYVCGQNKKVDYIRFIIRRVFRIYPAYIVAILFSLALKLFLFNKSGFGDLNVFSDFINQFWNWKTTDLSVGSIIKHIIMIGPDFERGQIDPIIWSIIVEMKISIIFPLIIYLIKRTNSILTGTFLFIVSLVLCYGLGKLFLSFMPSIAKDILAYLPMFILGGLLAKFHKQIIMKIIQAPKALKFIMLAAGTTLYANRYIINNDNFNYSAINYITSFGVALIILTVLSSSALKRMLVNKIVKFLGDISYSFYLIHFPIIMTATSYIYLKFHSIEFSLVACLGFSLAASYVSYKLIEMPFQNIGRILSRKVSSSRNIISPEISSDKQVKAG